MGKDGLKVDWKKAARASLEEEVSKWEDWKWQKAQKRWQTFRTLNRIKKLTRGTVAEKWEMEFYLRNLKPDFGPSHAILGLRKRQSTDPESISF